MLQHIILAHHGTAEFGSPRLPATPEALAVHAIENMDAKLNMALAATRGEGVAEAAAEGNWTEYMKAFSTRMYRPDVAPSDAQESQPLPEPPANPMAITNPLFESAPPKKK